jgi:hypothetical protein
MNILSKQLSAQIGLIAYFVSLNIYAQDVNHELKTSILPSLKPAFVQHAYVLPPGKFATSLSYRITKIEGDSDFFKNGNVNQAVFKDLTVERQFMELSFFYGIDLKTKYLHDLTIRVNIPYLDSQVNGFMHPHGQQFLSLDVNARTQQIGDIGIFLKKNITYQGNGPFSFAIVGGIFLPTGHHNEKFNHHGQISAKRPQPSNATIAEGYDALQTENVANGIWGDKRCFFYNFNLDHRTLCDGGAIGTGGAFGVSAASQLSFAPGGANFDKAFVGDFPFNNGTFGRFAGDGRLPSILQPGTGKTSFLLGAFLTHQFKQNHLLGQGALHFGLTHKFVSKYDGVDFGDITTYFMSLVKPIYHHKLSLDLSLLGIDHEHDDYKGTNPEPSIHTCNALDIDNSMDGCVNEGDEILLFNLIDRQSFSGGFTGLVAPSLILNPIPRFRLTLSGIFRVIEPDLGPAPAWTIRLGLGYRF